jgi:hypothetical protein
LQSSEKLLSLLLLISFFSYDQLKAMFNEYKKISGHMFEEKLKNELSNNKLFLDCVISFSRFLFFLYFTIYNELFFFLFSEVDLIIDSNSYFARLLHESTNGSYILNTY